MVQRYVPDRYPPDTGCDLHPKCLECPRPTCRYDDTPETIRPRNLALRQQIRHLHDSGLTYVQIATKLGISKRTVTRTLKTAANKPHQDSTTKAAARAYRRAQHDAWLRSLAANSQHTTSPSNGSSALD